MNLKELRRAARNHYWRVLERWWPKRYFNLMIGFICKAYEADLKKAEDEDERRDILGQRDFECSEYEGKLQSIRFFEMRARGEQVYVSLDDVPLVEGQKSHWEMGQHGTYYVCPKSFRALAKLVETAEYERDKHKRERREIWIKYFTAIAAAIGAIASVYTVLKRE